MKRTDRIPLSPRRPSLSGRFLCPHAAIFGFHSHACSPCVELIGSASRPRDFFPQRAMANALYPRLIALNSAKRIHPRTTSHKKWRTFEETLRFSPKSPLLFLKIPRFPKESCGIFDLGRLQNTKSGTKKNILRLGYMRKTTYFCRTIVSILSRYSPFLAILCAASVALPRITFRSPH